MANEFIARNGLIAKSDSTITGSLNVTTGITGSVFGTSSWASNSTTASYVQNADSSSVAILAQTSSYTLNVPNTLQGQMVALNLCNQLFSGF